MSSYHYLFKIYHTMCMSATLTEAKPVFLFQTVQNADPEMNSHIKLFLCICVIARQTFLKY